MRAYHLDVRTRIVAAVADGIPIAQVARQCRVHRSTVFRYLARQRDDGTVARRQHPGPHPVITPADEPHLVAQLQRYPAATLAEHCACWAHATTVHMSTATMCRAIQRVRWTRKKGVWQPANGMPTRGLSGGTRP